MLCRNAKRRGWILASKQGSKVLFSEKVHQDFSANSTNPPVFSPVRVLEATPSEPSTQTAPNPPWLPGAYPGRESPVRQTATVYLFVLLTAAIRLCSTIKKQSSAAMVILTHHDDSVPWKVMNDSMVPLISTPNKLPTTFPHRP